MLTSTSIGAKRLSTWIWFVAAPFSGLLLTMAFAPYGYALSALPALFFLLVAWRRSTPLKAAIIGYLHGLGLFGSGIWWIFVSIHEFGDSDTFSAVMLTALAVGFWSTFPALSGWLIAHVMKWRIVWIRLMLSSLLWVFVDYVRGDWLLNGFPWLQVGYSQLTMPLAGYAPILGVYGVSFVLVLSAVTLQEFIRRGLSLMIGIGLLLLLWGGGAWLRGVTWTHRVGEPIKITLVQGNIGQGEKWLPDQRRNTLRLYQQLTEQHWDAQVIIWPETAIPAFLSQVRTDYLDPLAANARQRHVDLVVGLPSEGEGQSYYNSVYALGDKPALYHKNHLLPFGEYLPLQPLSGWILDMIHIPLGNFSAGSDMQPLLVAGGHPFTTTICYEDAFGELVIRQIAEAAYIVNVTNDAWFGDTAEPFQHMQMAQMRALETGRFLVRATNTGLTGFVGPDGIIRKQAPLFHTTAVTDTITPLGGLTPYARWGNTGVFAMLALLAGVVSLFNLKAIKSVPTHLDARE
jgi:apolipoprotein N-acyltransferase